MTEASSSKPEPGPDATVDDIQADIVATRTELAETVAALTAKLDVKQQARHKVGETKELIADKAEVVRSKGSDLTAHVAGVATDDSGSVRPVVPIAALALVAIILSIVIRRSRGRS